MTPQEFFSQISLNTARFERVAAFADIPGFLSWQEGYALLTLAEEWPASGDVVEIGSFKGRSTCFLAQGCATSGRGVVYAVDHFEGSPEHQKGGHEETAEIVNEGTTYGAFTQNLAAAGLQAHVRPLVGSGVDVARDFTGQARMLFIDGDHSFDGTKADFDAWFPFVADTGLVCFHDYQNSHYLDGVTRFIETVIMRHPQMMFLHRADSLMTFMKKAA